MTVYSALLVQQSRQVLSGSCFVSVVICKLPSGEEVSSPVTDVSAWDMCLFPQAWADPCLFLAVLEGWARAWLPRWPIVWTNPVSDPGPTGSKFGLFRGEFSLCSVGCFNHLEIYDAVGQQGWWLAWFWRWRLIFIQLAQAQNPGEALNSFLAVFF